MSDDGGQAFPGVQHYSERDGEVVSQWAESWNGMTLRDYFAAKAMAGLLASREVGGACAKNAGKCAAWAYEQADAMLKARDA